MRLRKMFVKSVLFIILFIVFYVSCSPKALKMYKDKKLQKKKMVVTKPATDPQEKEKPATKPAINPDEDEEKEKPAIKSQEKDEDEYYDDDSVFLNSKGAHKEIQNFFIQVNKCRTRAQRAALYRTRRIVLAYPEGKKFLNISLNRDDKGHLIYTFNYPEYENDKYKLLNATMQHIYDFSSPNPAYKYEAIIGKLTFHFFEKNNKDPNNYLEVVLDYNIRYVLSHISNCLNYGTYFEHANRAKPYFISMLYTLPGEETKNIDLSSKQVEDLVFAFRGTP